MCNRAAVGVILGAFRSPHSRLRRQCGVIYNVTARAVNIAGFQFFTLIRHLKHNRASGCNFNNPMLTASEAEPATWGKPIKPIAINRGAVADPAVRANSHLPTWQCIKILIIKLICVRESPFCVLPYAHTNPNHPFGEGNYTKFTARQPDGCRAVSIV